MRGTGVADLVAELVADGRDRDAVIVGMLGELGMTDRAALAVRVRDAIDPRPTSPTFGASHTLAAAIDRVASTGAPGDPLLRGRRARGLSRAALYETLEHLGVSVAALQQSARVAMGAR